MHKYSERSESPFDDFLEFDEGMFGNNSSEYFEERQTCFGNDVDHELEIIGSRDTRKRRSQSDMTRGPFRFICSLVYDFPRLGKWPVATGILVGPSTVLTVGHLQEITGFDPGRLTAFPGKRGHYTPFAGSQAFSFKLPKGYESCGGSVSYKDYMLVFLKDRIGDRTGYWTSKYKQWSFDPDRRGTSIYKGGGLPKRTGVLKVNVCGYPLDKPNGQGCRKSGFRCNSTELGAPGRSRLCGSYQYSSFDQTIKLIEDGRTLEYRNDICTGQSGSPVWVKRHSSMGGRVLIGMQVCEYSNATANLAVFMHRQLREFIRRNTK